MLELLLVVLQDHFLVADVLLSRAQASERDSQRLGNSGGIQNLLDQASAKLEVQSCRAPCEACVLMSTLEVVSLTGKAMLRVPEKPVQKGTLTSQRRKFKCFF